MSTTSVASNTDFALFRRLMNRENMVLDETELQNISDKLKGQGGCKIEEIRENEEQDEEAKKEDQPKQDDDLTPEELAEVEAQIAAEEEEAAELDDSPGLFEKSMHSGYVPRTPPPSPTKKPEPAPRPNYARDEDDYMNADAENKNQSIRHKKMELLFLLRKRYPNEKPGWNLGMSLIELEYELNRREESESEESKIQLMKIVLLVMMGFFENLNRKKGSKLHLDNWSKTAAQTNLSEFDRCLARIYARYFRKSIMHPIVELMFIFVGSAVTCHARGKKEAEKSEAAFFNNVHDIRPPPEGPVHFDRPEPAANGLSALLHLFGGAR